MQELQEVERMEEEAGIKGSTPTDDVQENMAGSFMSESVYGKLNSPKARKRRAMSMSYIFEADFRTDINTNTTKTSCSRNKYSGISLAPC